MPWGRLAVDATVGVVPSAPWSYRFRAGFGQAADSALRSVVLCTGPFGDVSNGTPTGSVSVVVQAGLLPGNALEPPRDAAVLTPTSRRCGAGDARTRLDTFRRWRGSGARESTSGARGWVYAIGQGSLADRASTLHQRDKFNMTIDGGYISVDTASTRPRALALANRVARMIDRARNPL
jgi:hypothetical protein